MRMVGVRDRGPGTLLCAKLESAAIRLSLFYIGVAPSRWVEPLERMSFYPLYALMGFSVGPPVGMTGIGGGSLIRPC